MKARPPSPISLRRSATDQWRSKPITADRRLPHSGIVYHPTGGPGSQNRCLCHDPEPQATAKATATFQCNTRTRARLELDPMTISCIAMAGTRPIFYLVPVTRELSEAVATAQYPLSPTIVKKCLVAFNSRRLREGMETPDFDNSLSHLSHSGRGPPSLVGLYPWRWDLEIHVLNYSLPPRSSPYWVRFMLYVYRYSIPLNSPVHLFVTVHHGNRYALRPPSLPY
jgi:hypothetical protein